MHPKLGFSFLLYVDPIKPHKLFVKAVIKVILLKKAQV